MKNIGGAIAFLGLISIILNFMDYNLKILMWIDNWGLGTGWAIRAAFVVVGAVLFFLGWQNEKKKAGQNNQQ